MKKLLLTICLLLFTCNLIFATNNEIKKNEYYVPNFINPDIRKMYDNIKDYPYLIVQTVKDSDSFFEFFNEIIKLGYTKRISFFDWEKGRIYEFYETEDGNYYRNNVIFFNKDELVTKTKSLGVYNFYEYSDDFSSWKVYNLFLSQHDNLFCKNLHYSYDSLDKEGIFRSFYASSDEVWPFDYIDEPDWNYTMETQKTVIKENGIVTSIYNLDNEEEIVSVYEKNILDKYNFTEKSVAYEPYYLVSEGKIQNDKNGNVTKAVLTFDDGENSKIETFNYEYKYDSKNNWITKKSTVSNSESFSVLERQIYYEKNTTPITFESFVKEHGWFDFYFDELPDNFTQADFYSLSGDFVFPDLALEYYYKAYALGSKNAYNKILTLLSCVNLDEIMVDIKKEWSEESIEKFLPQLLKDYEVVSRQKK